MDFITKFHDSIQEEGEMYLEVLLFALPKALDSLAILCLHRQFTLEQLWPGMKLIFDIYKKLLELTVPVDDCPAWIDLLARIEFAVNVLIVVPAVPRFQSNDLFKFINFLVERALRIWITSNSRSQSGSSPSQSGSQPQNGSNSPQNEDEQGDQQEDDQELTPQFLTYENSLTHAFFWRFVTKVISQIASLIHVNTQGLFKFYQKEISENLVKLAFESQLSNPTQLLLNCMLLFGSKTLPKEILRWVIPQFMLQCNDQTKDLLDGVAQLTKQSQTYAFQVCFIIIESASLEGRNYILIFGIFFSPLLQNHLIDILIYIFYNCPNNENPLHRLCKVFQFMQEYSGKKTLITLLANPLVMSSFIDYCFKLYSSNEEATLIALSFITQVSTFVDPERLDAILETPIDTFSTNERKFNTFVENHFSSFIHRFGWKLHRTTDTIEEKGSLIESLSKMMSRVKPEVIDKFKYKIYFIIRMMLEQQRSGLKLKMSAIFDLLEQFISMVKTKFLQLELPSICFLVLRDNSMSEDCIKVCTFLFRDNVFAMA